MKKLNLDIKYLFGIWIFLLVSIMLTYGHHGHIVVDCGREVYYPAQILLGKVLYKDIFNIYGPFAYMFNALLFKIFGINLNVLYLAGCLSAFLISTFMYLIAKEYLSKFLSFTITLFTLVIGVFNLNLFNFIFPYSYGMLYGLVAFLISFWCLLKYRNDINKILYLYCGSFFAGLCITSKYEFLPYLLVVFYAIFAFKRLKFKEIYYVLFSLLFVPVFCFGILFLQGLRLHDLISTLSILKVMSKTQTLKYFYVSQGVFFNKHTIPVLLDNFIKTILPLCLFIFGTNRKNRFLSIFISVFSLVLIFLLISPSSFVFMPILVIFFVLFSLKSLRENSKLLLLSISCIAFMLKVIFGLATLNYGAYFVGFVLLTLIVLILEKFKDKNISQKALGIYVLAVTFVFLFQNIVRFSSVNSSVKTDYGKIYVEKPFSISTNQLIKFINENTKNTDKIVIFPEGLMVNYLTQRPSDDFYNSLLPLYEETFGEEKFIEHFKRTKPEYIVFNNWNTKDYYYKYICDDYARPFCSFVTENYTQQKVFDSGFRYLVFKLRP